MFHSGRCPSAKKFGQNWTGAVMDKVRKSLENKHDTHWTGRARQSEFDEMGRNGLDMGGGREGNGAKMVGNLRIRDAERTNDRFGGI
jgi:hypothetical protein